jgi:hypothetical protein
MLNWLFNHVNGFMAENNPHWRLNYSVIFLVLTIPFLIIIISGLYITQQNLNKSLAEQTRFAAYPIAIALDQQLEKIVSNGSILAANPNIRTAAQAENWSAILDHLKVYNSLSTEPFVDRLFIADAQGVIRADASTFAGAVDTDFSNSDWYEGALSTGKAYISPVYQRSVKPQYRVLAVGIPILGNDQTVHGILGLQIKIEHFFKWIDELDQNVNINVTIVDQRGQLVAESKNFLAQEEIVDLMDHPMVQNVLSGQRDSTIIDSPETKMTSIFAYEPIAKYGWGVILQQPAQTFLTQRSDFMAQILILCAILFIFYCLAVFTTLRAIFYYPNIKH